VESERKFHIFFENEIVAEYVPDIVVENKVIIETKTVKELTNDFKAQIIAQLRVTKLYIGFLVNFAKAELEFKRFDNFFELTKAGLLNK